jgi:hypothetical protein
MVFSMPDIDKDQRPVRPQMASKFPRVVLTAVPDVAEHKVLAEKTSMRPFWLNLHLTPAYPRKFKGNLLHTVSVNPRDCPTIGAVIKAFCPPPLQQRDITAYGPGGVLAPDTALTEGLANQTVRIEHSLPTAGRLRFVYLDHDPFFLEVDQGQLVSDLKVKVVSGLMRLFALPSTVSFMYFGCKLDNMAPLTDYGIPADSTIEVNVGSLKEITVDFKGKRDRWAYSPDTDRVADIRAALSCSNGISTDGLVFTVDNGLVGDDRFLADCANLVVRNGLYPSLQGMDFPAEESPCDPVASDVRALADTMLPSTRPPSVQLRYNGVMRSVNVDTQAPLKYVLPDIARQLGIVDQFELLSGPHTLDEDMAIGDLDPDLPMEVVPSPALTELTLFIALRPKQWRLKTVRLAPATTLDRLESDLRQDRTLTDTDVVEFIITNRKTNDSVTVGKEATIGSLGLDLHDLGIVAAGTDPASINNSLCLEGLASLNESASLNETAPQNATGIWKEPASGNDSVGSGTVVCDFIVADTEEVFQETFGPEKTVLDARTVIKENFGLADVSDVTLLFAGKILKDRFVLDRLRLGSDKIVVYMKQTEPMILYTMVSL